MSRPFVAPAWFATLLGRRHAVPMLVGEREGVRWARGVLPAPSRCIDALPQVGRSRPLASLLGRSREVPALVVGGRGVIWARGVVPAS